MKNHTDIFKEADINYIIEKLKKNSQKYPDFD
jgi:hypothetical protein